MTRPVTLAIHALLFIAPIFLLLILVFWDRQRIPLSKIILGISCFLPVSMIGTFFYRLWEDSTVLQSMLSLLSILIGIVIFSSLINYPFSQSVFIIIVSKCYIDNTRLLSHYIYFLFTGTMPEISPPALTALSIGVVICTFPLMYLLCQKLVKPALECSMSLPTWKLLWIIPLLNSIIFALIITPETLIKTSANPSVLYFLPPIWIALTFTTIFLLPRVIMAATQNIDLQRALQLSEIQITSQQKQNELLQLHIEETRRLRHDIRHHFRMLESLTCSQDMDGIKKYLSETLSSLPEQAPAIHCSNSAVNAFLCYFKELAVQQDIDMSLSISVPEKLPFPDTDLCIILGNLLENAVEACQNMKSGKRYIHVKMFTPSPQTMVIIIENSYEGSIRLAPDGNFLSSKEAGRHGIGISSVLSITEKYNGIPRFEYERNNIFKVSLLLNGTTNVP